MTGTTNGYDACTESIRRNGGYLTVTVIALVVLTVTAFFSAGAALADKASSANKRGIEAFDKQNYEESAKYFTDALVERPGSPELRYNRGTALSSLNKTDEALKELIGAADQLKTSSQTAAAHFNAGNTLLASNNPEAAIEEYKRAVKLDQSSRDIRHNLELAVRMLNQQKKEQEQEQQKEKEQKENGDQKNKQDQKDQEKKNEQQQKKNQQSSKTREPEQGEKKDQNQQESQQQDNQIMPMTQEEAQRLLDAINDEEKKSLSQRYIQMKSSMKPGDDW